MWSVLLMIAIVIFLLGWKGVIWFNMPSKQRYPVRGVDVSHYQGKIDFAVIAQQDMAFALIKATEGSEMTDECFAENWKNARDAALCTGAYHFFSFDSPAETQAENFIAAVPYAPDALPPVIDLEYYRSGEHPDAETVRKELKVLLDRFREVYRKTPIIYTTGTCYTDFLEDSGLDYILWIRAVYTPPADSLDWTFWQYNPRGQLDGYSGAERFIDLNIFRGTLAELKALGT